MEAFLAQWLNQRQPKLPLNIQDALEYALLGGGKRLRPALVSLCSTAIGGSSQSAAGSAIIPGAAIEMIHAFSLIHDDLPAMDDDDLRRGRPTLHKHAGEAMAILAGDILVSMAVEVVTGSDFPPDTKILLLNELFRGGCTKMIVGQVLDTIEDTDIHTPIASPTVDDEQRLLEIHHHKTGALIVAACRCGGIAGGATDDQLDALTSFATAVGLMFQFVDDLLDETQTSEHLGKLSGKDREKGKLTAPLVYGIEGTRTRIGELKDESLISLNPFGEDADPLRELSLALANRTR